MIALKCWSITIKKKKKKKKNLTLITASPYYSASQELMSFFGAGEAVKFDIGEWEARTRS